MPEHPILLRSLTPDFSKLKAVRYRAIKPFLGVCLWCGQHQVGGDGTVSSEQINLSFSPEIPSTAFDSSPLSPQSHE